MEERKYTEMDELKNYENEQLDAEQLEGVSGGYAGELSYDSKMLSQHGLCNAYDAKTIEKDEAAFQEVVDAWGKVGVKVIARRKSQNLYKVNGRYADIWAARKHLEKMK
ncbi:MAG: hypothetical protein IKE74_02040 [Mogibacterium sp.]|nr:hypothetical protein [Mogibacterium sp.]